MFRIDFNKLRFLVCDDNPHMRRILRTLLHSFGAREVYESEDGATALEMYSHYAPDIVIADWAMPIFDGLELAQMIRQPESKGNPFAPIIMLTGAFRQAPRHHGARRRRHRISRQADVGQGAVSARDEVVANPRPFIKTKNYFGPDRRRNPTSAYIGPERRTGGEAEVFAAAVAARQGPRRGLAPVWSRHGQTETTRAPGRVLRRPSGHHPAQSAAPAVRLMSDDEARRSGRARRKGAGRRCRANSRTGWRSNADRLTAAYDAVIAARLHQDHARRTVSRRPRHQGRRRRPSAIPAPAAAAESLCRIIDHAPDLAKVPAELIGNHIKAIQAIVREHARIDNARRRARTEPAAARGRRRISHRRQSRPPRAPRSHSGAEHRAGGLGAVNGNLRHSAAWHSRSQSRPRPRMRRSTRAAPQHRPRVMRRHASTLQGVRWDRARSLRDWIRVSCYAAIRSADRSPSASSASSSSQNTAGFLARGFGGEAAQQDQQRAGGVGIGLAAGQHPLDHPPPQPRRAVAGIDEADFADRLRARRGTPRRSIPAGRRASAARCRLAPPRSCSSAATRAGGRSDSSTSA